MYKYHEPMSINFKSTNICDICDKRVNNNLMNSLMIEPLFGWLYCNNCENTVKFSAITYINKTKDIPLHWFFRSNNQHINKLYFIDEQNNLYVDLFLKSYDLYLFSNKNYIKYNNNNNNYYITLYYNDVITNKKTTRDILINDIFMHNQWFYKELINCKNLFNDNNILISFNDLSNKIKNKINNVYQSKL
jgi:hypothetical protein